MKRFLLFHPSFKQNCVVVNSIEYNWIEDLIFNSILFTSAQFYSFLICNIDANLTPGHPRLRMNEFLYCLQLYGFKAPEVDYEDWKDKLETYVAAGGHEKDQEQHALMPLYHFCVNDLPATTRAPELDDRNAVEILRKDADIWTGIDEDHEYGVEMRLVGKILRYLVEIKFVEPPTEKGRALPKLNLSAAQLQAIGAVGGRGGTK